eukprot:GFUD01036263.1.p1 GENE.GFUD01036263.1~~GFUD01036263.1.p1  ORF type:complete len:913 (+),score=374.77 GFUD01036263.1:57-2795(+)
MDVPALLVFVGGFAVCAGVVFLISIFGAKEETFEEALAKQRKNNEKEKSKGKDKKKDVDKKAKNWRNKKKGEKEEKLDNMDDGEEESVVVVPSVKEPLLVEETVVETSPEPTPQPTPEPKQAKKDKKKEKKRIEIQEVDEVVEVQEVVEAPVVVEKVAEVEVVEVVEAVAAAPVAAIEDEIEQVPEPVKVVVKPSPTKQKAKKEKASTEAGPANPKDLLSVIKKTAFNDAEAQKLIDVLLTKQSGDPLNTSEEWIEKGKPTESQKLRAELNETFQVLEEERMKCKSFSDKMTGLRRELNEEKSVKANHNRIIEELTAARAQDVNNQNNKLQQFINENTLLKGQLSQEASHRRNIEMSQNHYQATIDSLNQQLDMARAAAASASANDPHVLSELEQLRIMRDKYENTLAELSNNNSNLKAQLTQQTEEVDTVKQQLGSSAEKVSQLSTTNTSLEAALVAKSDEAQQAAADLATMKVANDKVQAAPAIPVEVEAELNTIKQKLAEKDSETSRLMEENERLSEQLASSVERPAADGEEAGNADMNGHGEAADAAEAQKIVDEDWRDKFEVLHMEHEKMLAKQKMLQIEFETELSKYQGDMESIKSKNNDLNSSLAEAKKASTALLVRLFPALPPNLELSQLEEQAKESLEDLQAVAERTPSPSKPAPVEDNSEEMEKLESQVAHYKTVLAQTESMLNSLQASVESAETEWRLKLEVANKELNDVKMQNSSLAAKASDLEASSAIAKQAEEMQVQLADLQQKLAGEEEEKTGLAKVNQELKENSEDMSQEVERLSKELTEERSEKKELSNKVTELVSANTTLQQLVGTAQEALEKENGVVKSIQDQVNSNKEEHNCSGAPQSETSLGSARSSVSKNSVKLQGQFYGTNLSQMACPFPDDWQYGTVPESIANEDELD